MKRAYIPIFIFGFMVPVLAMETSGEKRKIPSLQELAMKCAYRHSEILSGDPKSVLLFDKERGLRDRFVDTVKGKYSDNKTRLCQALLRRDQEGVIILLIDCGANVNESCNEASPDYYCCSRRSRPLDIAIENGYGENLIGFLLKNGASVNYEDGSMPPLNRAMHHRNDVTIVDLLLQHGADVNYEETSGERPLGIAIKNRRSEEIIELLLRYGSDQKNAFFDGEDWQDPLNVLIEYSYSDELIEFMVGCSKKIKRANNKSPLSLAVCRQRRGVIKALIRAEIDGRAQGLLKQAIEEAVKEDVPFLIKAAAEVDDRGANGDTIWHQSISCNDNQTIHALCAVKPALCNVRNNQGQTLLHIAVLRHNRGSVQSLVNAFADVTIQDNKGNTPLLWAVCRCNTAIVQLLLQRGAQQVVNTPNDGGNTPYAAAKDYGFRSIAKLLKKYGAKKREKKSCVVQ